MIGTFSHILIRILRYGPPGLFLAAFIEESVVPVPSVITMMAAGFFVMGTTALSSVSLGTLFSQVALPIALGLTLGSTVIYLLGYYFGKPLILKWGKYLTVKWEDIEGLEKYFEKGYSDELVLTILRIVPVVPIHLLAVFCGLIRLPLWNYLIFTFIGVLIRSYAVGFIGWRLGKLYLSYATIAGHTQTFLGILAILILVFWWLYRRREQKRATNHV